MYPTTSRPSNLQASSMTPSPITPLTPSTAANVHRRRVAEPLRKLLLKSKISQKQKAAAIRAKAVSHRRPVYKAATAGCSALPPREKVTTRLLLSTGRRLAVSYTIQTADFDHEFGKKVVSLMTKVDVHVPGRFFYPTDALRRTCRTLDLTYWPAYSKHDIDRCLDVSAPLLRCHIY